MGSEVQALAFRLKSGVAHSDKLDDGNVSETETQMAAWQRALGDLGIVVRDYSGAHLLRGVATLRTAALLRP